MRASLALLLLAASAASASTPTDSAALAGDASLRRSPDSAELAGLLTAGTPLTIVERRDGWVRVRVEGWIPVAAVEAAPTPVSAISPAPGAGNVEGAIRMKTGSWRHRKTAAGTSVFLLPARQGAEWEGETQTEESAARLSALDAEAARLKEDAARAMRDDSFSGAVVRRDELMGRRERLLDERLEILAAIHGRHEARARTAALAQTTTDAKGWFSFENVAAGTYTLYVRVAGDDLDVEWIEEVEVEQGTVRIDLDAESARDLSP